MRLATFNINNVNARLANLLAWLAEAKPDVVCLQELKAADAAFPIAAIQAAGYGAVWQGEPRWNGVAILARGADPVLTRRRLPGDPSDSQSRYIEAAVNGVLVASLYLPNGNPQPGPKFSYKLAWMERLIAHAATLQDAGIPVVLAGDYNVVPTDADIYPSRSMANNALVQPAPRAGFRRLLQAGWTDALHTAHPRPAQLHVLGLHARPLAPRRRHAPGPPATQPHAGPAAGGRRRGPRRARPARRQRPRAGLGGVGGVIGACTETRRALPCTREGIVVPLYLSVGPSG